MPAALVTLAIGAIGVLASRSLAGLVVFAVRLVHGLAAGRVRRVRPARACGGALLRLHSTFAAAALFLVADLVGEPARRPAASSCQRPLIAQAPLLGGRVLPRGHRHGRHAAAVGLHRQAADPRRDAHRAGRASGSGRSLLATSLVVIVGFARAGSLVFWRSEEKRRRRRGCARPSPRSEAPLGALAAVVALLCDDRRSWPHSPGRSRSRWTGPRRRSSTAPATSAPCSGLKRP